MKIAQQDFTRVSPAYFAERVELPPGWTVLRFSHLGEKHRRRFTHGKWVVLKSGDNTIFRIVRYSVTLSKAEIVLDWAGWIDLQGRDPEAPEKMPIEIRTPRFWEYFVIPFKHVDPGYRMSAWLGTISIGLGLLSVILSIT